MKVYCINCKFFDIGMINVIGLRFHEQCDYPGNLKKVNTWKEEKNVHKRSPRRINWRNNCKWYIERR